MKKTEKKMDQNKPCCTKCNSKDKVVKIVYGKPGKVLQEKAQRKEIYLGGCMVPQTVLNWYCFNCSHKFE
ncbi:hypothetical protein ABPG73_008934 [Tetrahymena malaccensis]